MEPAVHNINSLFSQLGLPSSNRDIAKFLALHQLPRDVPVHYARFWSPSQAEFLHEALYKDSDWTNAVDELISLLHS